MRYLKNSGILKASVHFRRKLYASRTCYGHEWGYWKWKWDWSNSKKWWIVQAWRNQPSTWCAGLVWYQRKYLCHPSVNEPGSYNTFYLWRRNIQTLSLLWRHDSYLPWSDDKLEWGSHQWWCPHYFLIQIIHQTEDLNDKLIYRHGSHYQVVLWWN